MRGRLLAVATLTLGAGGGALAGGGSPFDADILDLSIAELMQINLTSAAKKPQSLLDTAAAAFVITETDIRRSGATTLPDLLRMVPGFQVAGFNAHTWAVSSRGFTDVYSRMLLVLIDGRPIYDWVNGNVRWYRNEMMLENIERIEVIRGPGGTLWGANAVNGVVNIITKSSHDTRGGLAVLSHGDVDRSMLRFRYGDALGSDDASFNVYAKLRERKHSEKIYFEDGWETSQAGFRVDTGKDSPVTWSVSGDYLEGRAQDSVWAPARPREDSYRHYNLLARRSVEQSPDASWHVQFYYDHQSVDTPHRLETTDVSLEVQQKIRLTRSHEVVWGLGSRWSESVDTNEFGYFTSVQNPERLLLNAFAQDEIDLVADSWKLIVGAKLEYDDDTDETRFMPNLRLLWRPSEQLSAWGAVSSAYRTPSTLGRRAELDFVMPGMQVLLTPNPELKSERMIAYEAGLRGVASEAFSWDVSIYRNEYRDVIDRVPTLTTRFENPLLILHAENVAKGRIQGLEVAADYSPWKSLSLRAAYAYLDSDVQAVAQSEPEHQFSLRAGWQVNSRHRVDAWYRYVDQLCHLDIPAPFVPFGCVPAYETFDFRYAYSPNEAWEISLVGINLAEKEHVEFDSNGGNVLRSEVPRSGYVQVRFAF